MPSHFGVVAALWSFVVGGGCVIAAVTGQQSYSFAISPLCEMRRCRCTMHFTHLLQHIKQYQPQELPTQIKFKVQDVWARIGEMSLITSVNRTLVEGSSERWLGKQKGKRGCICVCVCTHCIVPPVSLGQPVRKSEAGGGATAAVRQKYSAARHDMVYRGSSSFASNAHKWH